MPPRHRPVPWFLALGPVVVALAACASLTPGQKERNDALWDAARSCENGSLRVTRMSTEGVPSTMTVNSGGSEWKPFETCYVQKATPIWQAYCAREPASPQCHREVRLTPSLPGS
jgi:hypothetical protein